MFYKKQNITSLAFNSAPSYVMHIDLNSCFATIEQQAKPSLRGKPIAVAAYTTPSGCILAPSVEAKEFGVKTGMRVKDGRELCPDLVVMSADPAKYRFVHLSLRKILEDYTNDFYPKSIDEFVLHMEGYPATKENTMQEIAKGIKARIKREVGEWLTVSVGIAPNRFLAKTASGLHKPDGLDEINKSNFYEIYRNMDLKDLNGINVKNTARLMSVGINSVIDFYKAPLPQLKAAFASILSLYWYFRLRGWEIDTVEYSRKSFGNSYALPKPLSGAKDLSPILTKLVEKMGTRLRRKGYKAQGIHLAVSYRDGDFWHKGSKTKKVLFDSRDLYKHALRLLLSSPTKPVRDIAVSSFNLTREARVQLELFDDVIKKQSLVESLDTINDKMGNFTIMPGRMLAAAKNVPDRISFGNIKELEEVTIW